MVSLPANVATVVKTTHTSVSMALAYADTASDNTQPTWGSRNSGEKMALNNPLANVLSAINNGQRVSHNNLTLKNNSKVIRTVLDILKEQGYVQSYEIVEDGKGGILNITLAGTINKVGVITPNFPVKKSDYQTFEQRYLPARDFGILVVSTSQGMMTHTQAKELGIGGRLIAYCY